MRAEVEQGAASEAVPPDGARTLGTVACVLTGASRGFGRSLALALCRRVRGTGSCFLLLARSREGLAGVAGELRAACPGLEVRCEAVDLGTEEGLQRAQRATGELPQGQERLLLIHNAGSVGDISKYFVDHANLTELNSYFAFNVVSPMCLTAAVLRAFVKRAGLRRVVVNITSVCALEPCKSLALYCTGKAARGMMFQVLAVEEPDVRVLNYSPGPLDTDMFQLVCTDSVDPEIRCEFQDMQRNGEVSDCNVPAEDLVNRLLEDTFQSGSHVAFRDP
ncbi:sepiapterin reductase-like [Ambystoma mexicanum]|uniref:sepiapterin reductase-like n=1 Tax=Ambystoma mexicanum TaxID=8296 RepID=UPI0037E7163E